MEKQLTKEFNADSEFYGNYLKFVELFNKIGWKQTGVPNLKSRKLEGLFIKDGLAIYILYGCEEDIKEEIL